MTPEVACSVPEHDEIRDTRRPRGMRLPPAHLSIDGAQGLGRHLKPVDDSSQVAAGRAAAELLLDDLRERLARSLPARQERVRLEVDSDGLDSHARVMHGAVRGVKAKDPVLPVKNPTDPAAPPRRRAR